MVTKRFSLGPLRPKTADQPAADRVKNRNARLERRLAIAAASKSTYRTATGVEGTYIALRPRVSSLAGSGRGPPGYAASPAPRRRRIGPDFANLCWFRRRAP